MVGVEVREHERNSGLVDVLFLVRVPTRTPSAGKEGMTPWKVIC